MKFMDTPREHCLHKKNSQPIVNQVAQQSHFDEKSPRNNFVASPFTPKQV